MVAKFFIFIIFAIFSAIVNPVLASRISLHNFLAEVDQSNQSIQSAQQKADAYKHKIGPSSSLDDPFLAFGLDEIPFDGGMSKVKRYQISQSIPFPGKLHLKEKMAESRHAASNASAETIKRQIRVIATQLYLKAQYNEASIKSYEQIKTIIESITTTVKAKYKTGENNHHEWIQVKLELSILNIEILRLKRLQENLKASLNELRNKPPETAIEFMAIDSSLLSRESEETTLDSQPELKSLSSLLNSSEQELKLAKLSYAPDFVIQGMAMEPAKSEPDSMEKSNWGFMVGINIPLYFWNKQKDNVSAAEKDRLSAIADLNVLKNRIQTEQISAKKQLETSLDVVKLYKDEVIPLSEIAVKNARGAYAANRMSLKQLLETLQTERVQRLEYLGAQMDVVVSKMRLKDILSNPPLTRFAPVRPSTIGAGMNSSMNDTDSMESPSSINTGSGMSIPKKSDGTDSEGSASGMGGM